MRKTETHVIQTLDETDLQILSLLKEKKRRQAQTFSRITPTAARI